MMDETKFPSIVFVKQSYLIVDRCITVPNHAIAAETPYARTSADRYRLGPSTRQNLSGQSLSQMSGPSMTADKAGDGNSGSRIHAEAYTAWIACVPHALMVTVGPRVRVAMSAAGFSPSAWMTANPRFAGDRAVMRSLPCGLVIRRGCIPGR